MRTTVLALAAAAVLAVAIAAPASAGRDAAKADIVGTAVDAGQFTTLAALLKQAGLVKTLEAKGPYTVFAPTDKAFKAVPKATLDALAKDKALLRQVLLYHVVPGNVTASKVVKLRSASTVSGSPVGIAVRGGSVFLNRKTRVVTPDVKASNGTIHVIDRVLLPPNVVGAATYAGQFTTLTSLLKRAGLVKTLQGTGPYTVFAPTDKAFAAVPKATLDALGKDRALLRQVLLYHVVGGNVPAAKVVKLRSASTVQGEAVQIAVRGGKVFLNGSTRVVATDVKATNGVIHAIDRVLLPPS